MAYGYDPSDYSDDVNPEDDSASQSAQAMPQADDDRQSESLRSPDYQQAQQDQTPQRMARAASQVVGNLPEVDQAPQVPEPPMWHHAYVDDNFEAQQQAQLQAQAAQEQARQQAQADRQAAADARARDKQIREINKSDPYQDQDGAWKVQRADPQTGDITESDASAFAKVDPRTGDLWMAHSGGGRVVVGQDQNLKDRAQIMAQRKAMQADQQADSAAVADLSSQLGDAKENLKEYGKTPDALNAIIDRLQKGIDPNSPNAAAQAQLAMAQKRLADWQKDNPDYQGQKDQLDSLQDQLDARKKRMSDRRWAIIGLATDPDSAQRMAMRPIQDDPGALISQAGDVNAKVLDSTSQKFAAQQKTTPTLATLATLQQAQAQGAKTVAGKPIQDAIDAVTPKAPGTVDDLKTSDAYKALDFQGKVDALQKWVDQASNYQRQTDPNWTQDKDKAFRAQNPNRPGFLGVLSDLGRALYQGVVDDIPDAVARTARAFSGGQSLHGNAWYDQLISNREQDKASKGQSLQEQAGSEPRRVLNSALGTLPVALASEAVGKTVGGFLGGLGGAGAGAPTGPGEVATIPGGVIAGQKIGGALLTGAVFAAMAKDQLEEQVRAKFLKDNPNATDADWQKYKADNGVDKVGWEVGAANGAAMGVSMGLKKILPGAESIDGISADLAKKFTNNALAFAAKNIAPIAAKMGIAGVADAAAFMTGGAATEAGEKAEGLRDQTSSFGELLKQHGLPGAVMGVFNEGAELAKHGLAQVMGAAARADGKPMGAAATLPDLHAQLLDAQAKAETARNNGQVDQAAQLDEQALSLADQFHQASTSSLGQIPGDAYTALAKAGDGRADVEGNQAAMQANPALHFASAEVGRALRETGDDSANNSEAVANIARQAKVNPDMAQFVADQHAGLGAIKDLTTILSGKPIDATRAQALESVGLLDAQPDPATGEPRYRVTDDAIPMLPRGAREAIKANPDRFPIAVTPGDQGDMLNSLVKVGQKRMALATAASAADNAKAQARAAKSQPKANADAASSAATPTGADDLTQNPPPQQPNRWNVETKRELPTGDVATDKFTVAAPTREAAEAMVRNRAKAGGHKIVGLTIEPHPDNVSTSEPIPTPVTEAQGGKQPAEDSVPGGKGSPEPVGKPGTEPQGGLPGVGHPAKPAGVQESRPVTGHVFAALQHAGVGVREVDTPTRARVSADGSISIDWNQSEFGDNHARAREALDEELRHVGQMTVVRDQWRAEGSKGDFRVYFQEHGQKMFRDLQGRWNALEEGDEKKALGEGVVSAFNLYTEDFRKEQPKLSAPEEVFRALSDGSVQDAAGNPFTESSYAYELGRMLSQDAKRGRITEQTLRDFLGNIWDWLKDSVQAIRRLSFTARENPESAIGSSELMRLVRQSERELSALFGNNTERSLALRKTEGEAESKGSESKKEPATPSPAAKERPEVTAARERRTAQRVEAMRKLQEERAKATTQHENTEGGEEQLPEDQEPQQNAEPLPHPLTDEERSQLPELAHNDETGGNLGDRDDLRALLDKSPLGQGALTAEGIEHHHLGDYLGHRIEGDPTVQDAIDSGLLEKGPDGHLFTSLTAEEQKQNDKGLMQGEDKAESDRLRRQAEEEEMRAEGYTPLWEAVMKAGGISSTASKTGKTWGEELKRVRIALDHYNEQAKAEGRPRIWPSNLFHKAGLSPDSLAHEHFEGVHKDGNSLLEALERELASGKPEWTMAGSGGDQSYHDNALQSRPEQPVRQERPEDLKDHEDPEKVGEAIRARYEELLKTNPGMKPENGQKAALSLWSMENGKRMTQDQVNKVPFLASGTEHLVHYDEARNRVFKTTKAGKFGHRTLTTDPETLPFDNLDRHAAQNALFGDDTRFEGIIPDSNGMGMKIVTSQPYRDVNESRPLTFPEIEHYLTQEKGFVVLEQTPGVYFHPGHDIALSDVNPTNIVRLRNGKIGVLDLVLNGPSKDLMARIEAEFGGPQGVEALRKQYRDRQAQAQSQGSSQREPGSAQHGQPEPGHPAGGASQGRGAQGEFGQGSQPGQDRAAGDNRPIGGGQARSGSASGSESLRARPDSEQQPGQGEPGERDQSGPGPGGRGESDESRVNLGNDAFREATKPESIGKLAENVLGREMASSVPLEVLDGGMLAALKNDKVREAVVSLLPVNVVNALRAVKATPEEFFSNQDVVANRLPVAARETVFRGIIHTVREAGASIRAKLRGLQPGGGDPELLPALRASDLNSREVAGLLDSQRLFHGGASGTPEEAASAGSIAEPLSGDQGRPSPSEDNKQVPAAELARLLNNHAALSEQNSGIVKQPFQVSEGQALFARRDSAQRSLDFGAEGTSSDDLFPSGSQGSQKAVSGFLKANGVTKPEAAEDVAAVLAPATDPKLQGVEYALDENQLAKARKRSEALASGDLSRIGKEADQALGKSNSGEEHVSSIIPKLVSREVPVWNINGSTISTPGDFAMAMQAIRSPYFESLKVAFLDDKNQVRHSQILHVGTVDAAIANPRDLLQAWQHAPEAKRLLIAHNHPSGNPEPSIADNRMTEQWRNVAKAVGLDWVDHVITNGQTYYSFAQDQKSTLPKPAGLAPWEGIPRDSLTEASDPQRIAQVVAGLRTGAPDAQHVVYVNTRLAVTGLERYNGSDLGELTRRILKGVAREGAYGYMVDLRGIDPADRGTFLARMKSLQLGHLLDASWEGNQSARMAGMIGEEPGAGLHARRDNTGFFNFGHEGSHPDDLFAPQKGKGGDLEDGEEKPKSPNSEPQPHPDLDLERQSEESIKADQEAQKKKEAMEAMREKQRAPMEGRPVDTTADLFGEGKNPLFNERRDIPKRTFAVNPASDFLHDEREAASQERLRNEWIHNQADKITANDIAAHDYEKINDDVRHGRRGMTAAKAHAMINDAAEKGAINPGVAEILKKRIPLPIGIQDFGEKIHGARKDTWVARMQEPLPEDAASITLSKHWPEPDYEQALKDGVSQDALATFKAIRDMVPPKPRNSWKISRWGQLVKGFHGLSQQLISGEMTPETVRNAVYKLDPHGNIFSRISLYKELGYPAFTKAGDWDVKHGNFSVWNGQKMEEGKPITYAEYKGRMMNGPEFEHAGNYAEGLPKVAQAIKERIEAESGAPKTAKPTEFNIYQDRFTKEVFIGKKGVSGVVRLKAGFSNAKEARQYLADNQKALEDQWNGLKVQPDYRKELNAPRQGPIRRDDEVAPQQFQDAFGFRGVQFGNYVEGERRQTDLNHAYDALMDLGDALGIPAKALSMDGQLGLAFGARGTGGKGAALAHYEPGQVVINLTKKEGPGNLAHEWFHALDNYFQRQNTGQEKTADYATEKLNILNLKNARPDVARAFDAVKSAVNRGGYLKRSLEADQAKTKPYWSTTRELTARAFERYLQDRLTDKHIASDYLVNIGAEDHDVLPTKAEMDGGIRQAFDQLFNTLDTREGKNGEGSALYARPDQAKGEDTMLPRYRSLWIDKSGNVTGSMSSHQHEELLKRVPGYANLRVDERIARAKTQLARARIDGNRLVVESNYGAMTPSQRRIADTFAIEHGLDLKTNDQTRVFDALHARKDTGTGFFDFGAPQKEAETPKETLNTSDATRFRPRERVEFKKPITGPSGAKLAAYRWAWQPEEYVDKRGEDRVRRVSNWEDALSSDHTGRDLVHQFEVAFPDGSRKVVSAESIPGLLGYQGKENDGGVSGVVSSSKTLAKLQMQLAALEAQKADNDRISSEVAKLPVPEMAGPHPAWGPDSKVMAYSIPGSNAWQVQHEAGPATAYTKGSLERQWREEQEGKRGASRITTSIPDLQKRIEKLQAKLNARSSSDALHSRPDTGTPFFDFGGGTTTAEKDQEKSSPFFAKAPEADSVAQRVKDNLGLAVDIANQYRNTPADMSDVISEARQALVQAARGHDPEKGPFAPYAATVIRHALDKLYGRETRYKSRYALNLDEPTNAANNSQEIGGSTRAEMLQGDDGSGVSRGMEQDETNQHLDDAVNTLPERPRNVLRALSEGKTLEEIGDELGITRQSVFKIADNARKAVLAILRDKGFRGVDSDGVLYSRPDRGDDEGPDDDGTNGPAKGKPEAGGASASGKPFDSKSWESLNAKLDKVAGPENPKLPGHEEPLHPTPEVTPGQHFMDEKAAQKAGENPKPRFAKPAQGSAVREEGAPSLERILRQIDQEADRNVVPRPGEAEKPNEEQVGLFKDFYSSHIKGRIDKLNYFAPGTGNAILDSERRQGLVTAAMHAFHERMEHAIKQSFGFPSWWRNTANKARLARFREKLLPVASRLNATDVDGNGLVFSDFKQRAGILDEKDAIRRNVTTGGTIEGRDGETLHVGKKIRLYKGDLVNEQEANRHLAEGRKVQIGYQLERPMPAEIQRGIHAAFHEEFPEAAHWLDAFIAPGRDAARLADPQFGVELPDFNRNALRSFYGEQSPYGDLASLPGYTPDVARAKSIAGMIGSLLRYDWQSPARQYKTGEARERGELHDLLTGFSLRAAQAHEETMRRKTAESLIKAATRDVPPDGVPAGWKRLDSYFFNPLVRAARSMHGLSDKELALLPDDPAFADKMNAANLDTVKKLVGDTELFNPRRMVRQEIYSELMRDFASSRVNNRFMQVMQGLTNRMTTGLLAHPYTALQQLFGNEIFKTMKATQRANYGVLRLMDGALSGDTGASRDGRIALREARNIFQGLVTDRWWNPIARAEMDQIAPKYLFEKHSGLKAIMEEDLGHSIADSLKQANVGSAVLKALRYGEFDARTKQQLASASYRAHAREAIAEAMADGSAPKDMTKAEQKEWMRKWILAQPDDFHREVQTSARVYAHDYANIPWWLDDKTRVEVHGVDVTPIANTMRRLIMPFGKYPYNYARQIKRLGVDSLLDLTVRRQFKTRAQQANALANLSMLSMLMTGAAMATGAFSGATGGGDSDDKDTSMIGTSYDQEGGRLEGAFNTGSRINLSKTPMGRVVRAAARMFGAEGTDTDDYWMRVRSLPYANVALSLNAAMQTIKAMHDPSLKGHAEDLSENLQSLLEEFVSTGLGLRLGAAMAGYRTKFDENLPMSVLAGQSATDFLTGGVLPRQPRDTIQRLVDPIPRRVTPSKAFDYEPGFLQGVESSLPGLESMLPPAGRVVPRAGIDSSKALMAQSQLDKMGLPQASRMGIDEKTGKPFASYVDPATVRPTPRWTQVLRMAGLNLKPVNSAQYRDEIRGLGSIDKQLR